MASLSKNMESNTPSKIDQALNLEYSKPEEIWLTKQNSLRKLVGILGMLLPILLWAFLYLITGYTSELESISHYYYTRANGVFIITVSLLAVFLLIYKGKDPIDFYLSSAAGIFAFGFLLFPTDNLLKECSVLCDTAAKNYAIAYFKENDTRVIFHFVSAAIFLLSLALMSLFIFTKSDKPVEARTSEKKWRNRIYRTCGVVMIIAVAAIPALRFFAEQYFNAHNVTFWMEVVAVESFGISWLVKGEVILKDY